MSLATNGITASVIREMMPPYHLSADLLGATFAALPPPPADAPATWWEARVARLTQEFAALMPANAAQARIVSQMLVMRELADAIAIRAHEPELTPELMARVGRASAEVSRTASGLLRALERLQQKPVAFFGTVLADGVDLGALDAVWGKGAAAGAVARPVAGVDPVAPVAGTGGANGLPPGGTGGPASGRTCEVSPVRVPCSVVGAFLSDPGTLPDPGTLYDDGNRRKTAKVR